ncbi:putative dehydrogenase [Pontibacter ummariensis]|uniref:Predicted dehydrogenase n=1 Tax=Pontibacter ummariensis TaxID=1610492 RepID=A0A239ELR9_9BACT|nr:Gfo/Idh/MocA family oxidoreductase [Pontibacter ummariensis]PRY13295.1 putative dehydrogenase [Pontibacter ummariensis]SNS44824.1 Predicted dehydrogenase [Pontibacter ummariensis]
MRVTFIIGAGQLGSRHLQGLLKHHVHQKIYVVDPSRKSLETARLRAEEVEHQHEVILTSDWEDLPLSVDLVIVATNAGVRKDIVKKLLQFHEVKFLILEKVLFQDLAAYDEVQDLLRRKRVSVWVNHPRRMACHYQEIKERVSTVQAPVTLNVYGGNWGLACNAIHFLDLISYLTDSFIDTIDTGWVDDNLLDSKRVGHVEFTGTIKGVMKDGSQFTVTSSQGEQSLLTSFISAGPYRWLVSEGGGNQIVYIDPENDNRGVVTEYPVEFQSSLTTKLAEQLFEKGDCDLPTFEEAYHTHVPYIKALVEKYNLLSGLQTNTCPIT